MTSLGAPVLKGLAAVDLALQNKGKWSPQSAWSSYSFRYPWCFGTYTKLHGNANNVIVIHTSNFTIRWKQTAFCLRFNFNARTYDNTQRKPKQTINGFNQERRTWSKECTNAGTIRFLTSTAFIRSLQNVILLPSLSDCDDVDRTAALSSWQSLGQCIFGCHISDVFAVEIWSIL